MKHYLTIAIVLLITTMSCQEDKKEPVLTEARKNYLQNCQVCHGENYEGVNAPSLVDASWMYGARPKEIMRSIKYGIQSLGMPSFQDILTEDQIRDIVDMVKAEELRLTGGPSPTPDSIETQDYKINVITFADSLDIPWAIDFLDNETALVTERRGRLLLYKNGTLQADSVVGTPRALHEGQGGLLDVAVDPNYGDNGWIYLAFSHELPEIPENEKRTPTMTKIVRGKLNGNNWVNEETIFEAPHDRYRSTRHHYGCRIVFDKKGYLYFSIGDRGAQDQAQDITRPNGKTHRIWPDGRIPKDNPFYNKADAIQTIYSFGNRNIQGMAIHPISDELWATEHGPLGGDELNHIQSGRNYGWPVITYGRNYNGTEITDIVEKDGMEQPNYYFKPSIAACGLDFYRGDLFPLWKNKLMVGALKYEEVKLLNIHEDRVMHEQTIVKNMGRVRDVQTGPDGAVYVVLNSPDKVVRLVPKE